MLVLTAGGKRARDALLRHKTVSSRSRGSFTNSPLFKGTDIVFPIPRSPITRLKYTYSVFSKLWDGLAQTV
jgi:hypothetical protein